MLDPKFFDDLAKKLVDAAPPGFRGVQEEVEKSIRLILQNAFNKLDLVTREEFDIQVQVLQRTRSKLEALEHKVAQLEQQTLSSPQS